MARRGAALSALSATVAVAFGSLFHAFSVLVTDEAAGSEFSTSPTAYGETVLVGGGLALAGAGGRRPRHAAHHGPGSLLGGLGLVTLGLAGSGWQIVAASWLLICPGER